MSIKKSARCHIRMDSRWVAASAACMGISVFIRTVYYFGLINLRDLDRYALAVEVIAPMIIAAGYLFIIKGFQFNSPVLVGGLMGVYAVNYLLVRGNSTMAIVAGALLVVTGILYVVTGLGYLPSQIPVIVAALILLLFRLFAVDVNGYILPFAQFQPIVYLPKASDFFGFLAVSLMAPPLNLTKLHSASVPSAEEEPASEETVLDSDQPEEAPAEVPADAPAASDLDFLFSFDDPTAPADDPLATAEDPLASVEDPATPAEDPMVPADPSQALPADASDADEEDLFSF